LLSESNGTTVADLIARIDQEHQLTLDTLPAQQREAIVNSVAIWWGIPMALWFGVGYTSPWWRPLIVRRRQVIGAIILVLGAGSLVAGLVDSDSFAGGLGAMMLVGGFLVWRNKPTER
jgi:hypothetical protein